MSCIWSDMSWILNLICRLQNYISMVQRGLKWGPVMQILLFLNFTPFQAWQKSMRVTNFNYFKSDFPIILENWLEPRNFSVILARIWTMGQFIYKNKVKKSHFRPPCASENSLCCFNLSVQVFKSSSYQTRYSSYRTPCDRGVWYGIRPWDCAS